MCLCRLRLCRLRLCRLRLCRLRLCRLRLGQAWPRRPRQGCGQVGKAFAMARLRARRHLPRTSLALGSLARAGHGDGPRARGLGRLPKSPHFSGGQVAPLARRQGAVRDRADAGPHQSHDRVADGLAHAPDLPVSALVDGDPGALGPSKVTRAGAVRPSSSSTPRRRRPHRLPGQGPSTSTTYSLATPKLGWVSW